MDGVHDLGGVHGFGPVDVDDDASFHADWERLVFAIDRVLKSEGAFNVDEKRHSIERMDPAAYLGSTYFERWLDGQERLLEEAGIVTGAERRERREAVLSGEVPDPEDGPDGVAERARESFESPASFGRDRGDPRFEPGDEVVVRNIHPEGHTRCPRYARRARGRIEAVRGTYDLPDASAHGGERAEPLYSVRFEAEELWGPDHEGPDAVYLDQWESYLEPP